jgi:hypothetical protein
MVMLDGSFYMIFILIALTAIILYIWEYKVAGLCLFFFFITSGFNLIPSELMGWAFISKSADYAFFILLGILTIDILFVRKYLKPDAFSKYLLLFFSFIVICLLYNKYSLQLSWSEIIRSCRYLFFWMAYFVFRNMEREQLEKLLKYLFLITVFLSVLYLLQLVVKENILNETVSVRITVFGINTIRFYNQPDMIQFFTLMGIYHNPYRGIRKFITSVLLIAALLGAFHRSLIGMFLVVIAIALLFRLPRLQRIKIAVAGSVLLLFALTFAGTKFAQSKTFIDLQSVASGEFADVDVDMEELSNSTFSFRLAHLVERNQYLLEHPKAMIFGAGLFPEDSKIIDKFFDFKIGLIAELTGNIIQLDTGDISYPILFLRYGYVGTFLNLLLFGYLAVFFYKKRENKYGLFSFLYLILAFGVSFFSANLTFPVTFLLPLISYHIIQKTESEKTE